MNLQITFMVSTTPSTKEVSEMSCSQTCIDKMKNLREHNDSLIREIEDLKYEGYTLGKANNL